MRAEGLYAQTERDDAGGLTTTIFAEPVNFWDDAGGEFVPIDNSLVPVAGERWQAQNEANSHTVLFPADPNVDPISTRIDDNRIDIRLLAVQASELSIDGETAIVEGVSGASEVTYQATNSGYKETVWLEEPPVTVEDLRLAYEIHVSPGLNARVATSGAIEFFDQKQSIVATLPAGYMYDSATPRNEESVPFSLRQTSDRSFRLVAVASGQWLTDPVRTYPVAIDPSLVAGPIRDCWMNENAPTTGHCGSDLLRVGLASDGKRRRSVFSFDVSSIPSGSIIASATFNAYLDSAQTSGSQSAEFALVRPGKTFSSSATWLSSGNSGAWVGGDPGTRGSDRLLLNGGTSGFKSWDARTFVENWVSGRWVNNGLLMKQTGENLSKLVAFRSSTFPTTSQRPTLTVEHTLPDQFSDPLVDPQSYDDAYYGPEEFVDSTPLPSPTGDAFASYADIPADAKEPGKYEAPDLFAAAPGYDAAYQPAVWGACGAFDSEDKIIRTYPRLYMTTLGKWVGRYAYLNCGKDGNFGFSHIMVRNHDDDFAAKAAAAGSAQWRHAADFAMYGALQYPQLIKYNYVKDTYCVQRMVYIYQNDEQVNKFKATVILGSTGRRIISAYPSRNWCGNTGTIVDWDGRGTYA